MSVLSPPRSVVEGPPALEEPERPETVQALTQRLAAMPANAAKRDLVRRLLDDPELVDDRRAVVVAAQLDLGYPFALEITPSDLELLRRFGPSHPLSSLRTWIGISATLSMVWSAIAIASLGHVQPLSIPFAIAAAHGIAALTVAVNQPRRAVARGWLRALGWMVTVGPLSGAVAGSIAIHGAGGAMLGSVLALPFAAPAMVTAILCGVASRKLAEKGDRLLLPAKDSR